MTPERPADAVRHLLKAMGDRTGSPPDRPALLVTAGPTCEDIDAVRFLGNRSSGRQGLLIARAAQADGWPVLLVLGPSHLTVPEGLACVRVRSAAEMHEAVSAALDWCGVLVMAAAVADYRPAEPVAGKLRKQEGDLTLRLERTVDILAEAGAAKRPGQVFVGFSLEASADPERAREKLARKNLDLVVANSTAAFGGPDTDAVLIDRSGTSRPLPGGKAELAETLLAAAIERVRSLARPDTPQETP